MVTYNGKSFDWPAVKTRHTLIKEHVPKLPSFGHFDLYHAARRLWKHRLERIKLSIVEKEILGFERKDDIPGFLAPMIYFDYIERKNPEGMIGILKHNELDILSLITLYTHLTYQLLGIDGKQTAQETFEVGRWYSYIGESEAAEKVFSELSEGNETAAVKARHAMAFQAKKKKDWPRAIELWEKVAEESNGKMKLEACIELAKVYEHRLKQYDLALEYAERALSIQDVISVQEEILKRINRLKNKNCS
jgi:tetratricopeptide (TPR) repeat protein